MKQIEKTPFVTAILQQAVGSDVDVATLAVYEVRATSTVPLRGKDGTIFERGQISPQTITDLATSINADPIPLMMDHNMNGTPYGKFFYAEPHAMDNGDIELRGYMYVDPTEERIIAKLDSASIDEVSIQFKPQAMLCSECGFDYMQAAAEDNYMPFIELECDNGHKIGENGVHVRMVGVSETVELSMVSRGAAKNSKIIPPSDAKLQPQVQKLAAAGVELGNYYCTASASDKDGEEEVDFEKFMAQLTAANDKTQAAVVAQNAAEAQVASLTADVESRDETIATLTAERDALQTQVTEAAENAPEPQFTDEQYAALSDYIGKQYVALKALDGEADAKALDDVTEMVSFIDENSARLSAVITPGGVSQSAGGNDNNNNTPSAELKAQADAFRA